MIKRIIFLLSLLVCQLAFGVSDHDQTATVFYDPSTHKVRKPPTSANSSYDYDFTGLNLNGISAGAYQPIDTFLTSMLGLDLTDKMFYMLDPDTADAVELGSGLTFSGGTLGISSALISGQPSDIAPTANDVMLTLDSGTDALRKVVLQDFTDNLSLDFIEDSVSGFKVTINTAALTANRVWAFPDSNGTFGSGGGGGTPGGTSTQVQYNNGGSAFGGISGATTDGTILTLSGPITNSLQFTGNISQAAWGQSGVKLKAGSAQTFTDTTSSGNVSGLTTSNAFAGATINASSATTYAEYVNSFFKDPTAGTNVTMNAKYALGGDSAIFGSPSPGKLTITGAGLLTLPQMTLSGNVSQAAWGTAGLAIAQSSRTLTDTSSSGNVSGNTVSYAFGNNTIAASSATTYANYITGYYKDPVAGTNVTMTSKYALGADSAIFGTSNQATFSTAGVLTVPGSIVTPTITNSGGPVTVGGGGTASATLSGSTGITLTGPFISLAPVSGTAEELRFREDFTNGADYIGFTAPSSIPAILHYIFPATDAAGALTSDGSGNLSWAASAGGDALTTNPLSQFASTTSAQLRGVLSDESGSGVFLTTTGSAASLTSFPTLNQNTTGSAATLTTPRAIGGVNFDGSAAIVPTNISGGNGTTLLGSMPYQSATDTTTQLAPNTTTTKKFLRETGDGTNGTAPAWDTIVAGDVPTLNQNTTGSAATLTTSRNLWGVGFNGSAAIGGAIELGTAGTTDTTWDRSSAGVATIEGVKVLATNSTSGTQQGLVAVNSSSGAVVGTQARSSGTTTSGTAGTSVASITAGGSNQFVCINANVAQTNAANTQYTVTITYSDSTTTTDTSTAATNCMTLINDVAMMRYNGGAINTQTANSAKKITAIAVITAGTGTGTRAAALSAVEIPQ